jgi:hypothetical protein
LLLAPFPAAAARRQERAFGELLEWLDGHPLSMRLTLPRLDNTPPAVLLAGLQGTVPMPGGNHADAGDRSSSLAASITYSLAHLAERTGRLLSAVCLFHGVAHAGMLGVFSGQPGVPERFAGVSTGDWVAVLEDAARVGLLTPLGAGMYRVHPALPGYLAAAWQAEDPATYDAEREAATVVLVEAFADLGVWLSQGHSWSLNAVGTRRHLPGASCRRIRGD